jgi:hypothetical protein
MPTPFTALPQDMLQHMINHYLNPESRAEFNAVLKPDMRVYKKLEPDYALKHAIKVTFNSYTRIGLLTDYFINGIHGTDYRRYSMAQCAEKTLMHHFDLWFNPLNTVAIMYQRGLKEKLLKSIAAWMEEDPHNLLYTSLFDGGAKLRLKAAEALEAVKKIPFRHHISIADMDF